MKCFMPCIAETKEEEESRTVKPNLATPSPSAFLDEHDLASTSLNASDTTTSTESSRSRNTQFPNSSKRSSDLRQFTFLELKEATKKFSRSTKIGEGGFGSVYKGTIRSSEDPSRQVDVAIKQLNSTGNQGHKEWVTEVNVLGVVEHENLVQLIGYCAEDGERGIQRLLVYEYMPNSSVDNHLSARSETTLSWATRLRIARDAARGLAYLHEGMEFQIIFRDFKSANILLDEQWNAKLSDFGLARLGPSEGRSHVSTAVVGTLGYAAPEYIHTGHLSSKNDVWSYGMFLYELITGRRPLDRSRPKREQKLLEWVKQYISDPKKFQTIIDPRLKGEDVLGSAQKLSHVANRCLEKRPKLRPTMTEVLEMVTPIAEAPIGMDNSKRPIVVAEEDTCRNGKRTIKPNKVLGGWLVRIASLKRRKTVI
ncbi:unnamed protein product [Cuscuta epithymum]|uniref:non-specific serine/threonine protein kinase n=1 Tax=Cuscuta epithymum TaxID=186058 RepID=A0AAV0EXC0_9ASTE|nr:unnamed protein product [Cuscuta epithymum]